MFLAIDFDGTLCEHMFPEIGPPVEGAFEWLKKFQAAGARLILWTMRSDFKDEPFLTAAIEFCRENGVEFYAHNTNPHQGNWTTSPKCDASMFIDDLGVGCPLKPAKQSSRPVVDWDVVGPLALKKIEETLARRKRRG